MEGEGKMSYLVEISSCMRKPIPIIGFLIVALYLVIGCAGCSGEGGEPGEAEVGEAETKDYNEIFDRLRDKRKKTKSLQRVLDQIEKFKVEKGREPSDFLELVTEGYLSDLPNAGEGLKFHYNSTNGMVEVHRTR